MTGSSLCDFKTLSTQQWMHFQQAFPLPEKEKLKKKLIEEHSQLCLDEISNRLIPFTSLINSRIEQSKNVLKQRPFILGVCGSVSAGKTTTSILIQKILRHLNSGSSVDLISTDSFIYPLAVLKQKDLLTKKGFPESYDVPQIIAFLQALHQNQSAIEVPIYSHEIYDILANQKHTVCQPDIIIIEGLNLLQRQQHEGVCVTDFFDDIIYIDAPTSCIKQWYINRFMHAYKTTFQDSKSYFHAFSALTEAQAYDKAHSFWDAINGMNLENHILPSKHLADIILIKDEAHHIQDVLLR
tara:strand:- start:3234 stop:4124 length:891 start_codon:yes stop_codon:yes gene_type:complete